MIIHMEKNSTPEQEKRVLERIKKAGFDYEIIHGSLGIDVIGVLGDLSRVEESYFGELDGVDKVIRISKPYKLVSREYSSRSKVVDAGGVAIGGDQLCFLAGPCSLESESQIFSIAQYLNDMGITIMRGGAYKPRTSPYSFQGMGLEGLKLLAKVREQYGLKIITEATGLHHHIDENGEREKHNVLENVIEYADIIQIGARNMKSYGFLQELAILTKENKKPVLLKRGDSSTLKDFLLAAEYIVSNGNPNVILCLRGIRTFEEESFQRFTPDIGAITVLKNESNLPVIFDPSHSTGYRANVKGVSLAAVAAGADGLLIETHNDPANALCDGEQSVTALQLKEIREKSEKIRAVL
ncbi:3-deoxy-7-phosphoheptulonate synthase [Chitinispirillales bacterium ANBcel5]|uniref:3-deoxy-7-phosphoheptulonate synthase n=1 Tax=Cellulosispirillum alkaliphilum TaxID=3039283 RepID=UPI002A57F79E|nr:3-deoxy-7-phosphoheptulonate synthase [Chitinispirillales bacterium ANBcel5]